MRKDGGGFECDCFAGFNGSTCEISKYSLWDRLLPIGVFISHEIIDRE